MYRNFYGFREKPFDVTPDPRFLYLSVHHQEALSSIIYGILERRGFIALIGEVGTGKTTLLNAAMESLDEKIRTAFIFNTDIGFEELLQMVLVEFEQAAPDETIPKHVALDRLNRFALDQFAAGGNVVLFIDEAQNLDIRSMENLRLLSNLETRKHKLIQIVLSGQPELDQKLRKQELRQLDQRINMKRYLPPLSETDTYRYIRQHLEKAGAGDVNIFNRGSLKRIWEFSQGVPRRINLICDNALLIAFGLNRKKITSAIIGEAIRDLSWSPYDNQSSFFYDATRGNGEASRESVRSRTATIAAIIFISLLLGAGSFGFFQVGQSGMKNLISAAQQYFQNKKEQHPVDFTVPREKPITREKSVDPRIRSGAADHSAIRRGQIKPQGENKERSIPVTPGKETPGPREAKAPTTKLNQMISVKKPMLSGGLLQSSLNAGNLQNLFPSPVAIDPMLGQPDRPAGRGTGVKDEHAACKKVVVIKNDYLAGIVEKFYGEKTKETIRLVLRENPEIKNPDLIMPGQVIRMPIKQ